MFIYTNIAWRLLRDYASTEELAQMETKCNPKKEIGALLERYRLQNLYDECCRLTELAGFFNRMRISVPDDGRLVLPPVPSAISQPVGLSGRWDDDHSAYYQQLLTQAVDAYQHTMRWRNLRWENELRNAVSQMDNQFLRNFWRRRNHCLHPANERLPLKPWARTAVPLDYDVFLREPIPGEDQWLDALGPNADIKPGKKLIELVDEIQSLLLVEDQAELAAAEKAEVLLWRSSMEVLTAAETKAAETEDVVIIGAALDKIADEAANVAAIAVGVADGAADEAETVGTPDAANKSSVADQVADAAEQVAAAVLEAADTVAGVAESGNWVEIGHFDHRSLTEIKPMLEALLLKLKKLEA